MHWIDWTIMLVPFTAVLALAVYTRRYARDVVDYLAAGRVAGRYVICVGDVATALSVQVLVGNCESTYRAGSAMGFWGILTMPLGMFLSLAGYCVYRWRACRALSFGQFLEMRYSHSFRVTAATIRNFAEMITNSISPAIAANFFIYFLGLPHKIMLFKGTAFEVNLPCFAILVAISLTLALVAIWPAGRISLLVTDTFPEEVALILQGAEGLAVISGCSHNGIVSIVSRVAEVFGEPVRRFVGGTHLVNAGDERIAYTCRKLQDLGMRHLGACHCTGEKAESFFATHFPGFYRNNVGTKTEIC